MIRSLLFLWLNQMILTAALSTPLHMCSVVSEETKLYIFSSYFGVFDF